jgi:hypothetical protein
MIRRRLLSSCRRLWQGFRETKTSPLINTDDTDQEIILYNIRDLR